MDRSSRNFIGLTLRKVNLPLRFSGSHPSSYAMLSISQNSSAVFPGGRTVLLSSAALASMFHRRCTKASQKCILTKRMPSKEKDGGGPPGCPPSKRMKVYQKRSLYRHAETHRSVPLLHRNGKGCRGRVNQNLNVTQVCLVPVKTGLLNQPPHGIGFHQDSVMAI